MAVGHTTWDAARFLAAGTETEFKCPGELSEEQTAISLFRDRGLNTATAALTVRRVTERGVIRKGSEA